VQERLFVSWVGLRGAVSIFLAAIPVLSGVARADVYFNVAFVVVLASLVIQGWTVNPVARRLGLALPRAAPSVRRVELDLPGQLEHELVGYPILTESPILSGGNLPSWARPVLVIREAGILDIHEAGALRQGDFAYFLAPSRRVRHLDRLFAALAETPAGTPAPLGQFVFRGDVKIARLAEIYDLGLDPDESGLTLAELFEKRFDTRPEIGDRLVLGNAALVVRELDGERVSRVGLQIAGEAPPPALGAPAAFWQVWRESLMGTAKRLLGRKSQG
jgi:cell volume regulation protein A